MATPPGTGPETFQMCPECTAPHGGLSGGAPAQSRSPHNPALPSRVTQPTAAGDQSRQGGRSDNRCRTVNCSQAAAVGEAATTQKLKNGTSPQRGRSGAQGITVNS